MKTYREAADRVARQVDNLRDTGLDHLENDEPTKAIACFRRALKLAPFSRDLRECFEEALYDQALAIEEKRHAVRERRGSIRTARPARKRVEEVSDDEIETRTVIKHSRRKRRYGSPMLPWGPIMVGMRVGFVALVAILLTGGTIWTINRGMNFVGTVFASGGDAIPMISSNRLPEEVAELTEVATAHLRDGRPGEAVKVLQDGMRAHPSHSENLLPALVTAMRAQAGAEHRARNFEKAARIYREAGELTPTNPNNWIDLGLALVQQARGLSGASQVGEKRSLLSEAEFAFQRSLKLSPGNSSALLGLAEAYAAANERSKAAETYERIIASAPESPEGVRAEQALLQLRRR